MTKTIAVEHFGVCPECRKEGRADPSRQSVINLGKQHWFVCFDHSVRWYVGENLFTTAPQTMQELKRNRQKLEKLREIHPEAEAERLCVYPQRKPSLLIEYATGTMPSVPDSISVTADWSLDIGFDVNVQIDPKLTRDEVLSQLKEIARLIKRSGLPTLPAGTAIVPGRSYVPVPDDGDCPF